MTISADDRGLLIFHAGSLVMLALVFILTLNRQLKENCSGLPSGPLLAVAAKPDIASRRAVKEAELQHGLDEKKTATVVAAPDRGRIVDLCCDSAFAPRWKVLLDTKTGRQYLLCNWGTGAGLIELNLEPIAGWEKKP